MKNPSELRVRLDAGAGAATTALVYAAAEPRVDAALILGHGAGAGQRSTFMVDFARALSAMGADVVTFNFLYTEHNRKIPDRAPALEACYRAVIDAVRAEVATARRSLFIGGKSMGGRISTQVAAADPHLERPRLVEPLHPGRRQPQQGLTERQKIVARDRRCGVAHASARYMSALAGRGLHPRGPPAT